jgi:hypothetical protein
MRHRPQETDFIHDPAETRQVLADTDARHRRYATADIQRLERVLPKSLGRSSAPFKAQHRTGDPGRPIGNIGYPYCDTPRVMQGARQVFALLAVIALAATGVAAWQAFRIPSAILFAPLMLALSPLFFYQSWTYLNVDIVGLCFSTLTLAATLQGTRRPSMVQSAVIPGVFAGLTTGSKYTLALVIVPVLAAIGLYLGRGRRMWGGLLALTMMTVTFVAVTPYSLIDLPNFLSGVAFEAFPTRRAWDGRPIPGCRKCCFTRGTASDYGVIAVAVSIVGAASRWLTGGARPHFAFRWHSVATCRSALTSNGRPQSPSHRDDARLV